MASIRERTAIAINGFLGLLLWFAAAGYAGWRAYEIARLQAWVEMWQPLVIGLVLLVCMGGFFVNQPNEARALVFFGRYVGSRRESGFYFANPLASRESVSLRVHNFNSEKMKVNDARGNPIEIAAVIVWRVTDTARALFDVENYKGFVAIQSETAIRMVAQRFPYDAHEDEPSLRGSPEEISEALKKEVQARLDIAGIEVVDTRLSHLAYAPEIAQSMLRRQQAEAIVAARVKIVEGAVGMVEMGLRRLEELGIVHLDEERKASMVNNLLVALVADREAQPVINTGSLYS